MPTSQIYIYIYAPASPTHSLFSPQHLLLSIHYSRTFCSTRNMQEMTLALLSLSALVAAIPNHSVAPPISPDVNKPSGSDPTTLPKSISLLLAAQLILTHQEYLPSPINVLVRPHPMIVSTLWINLVAISGSTRTQSAAPLRSPN